MLALVQIDTMRCDQCGEGPQVVVRMSSDYEEVVLCFTCLLSILIALLTETKKAAKGD